MLRLISAVLFAILWIAPTTLAAIPIAGPDDNPLATLDVSVRGRYYADDRADYTDPYEQAFPGQPSVYANVEQPALHYGTSRAVLGVTLTPSSALTARLALQHESVLGEERPWDTPQGTLFLREGWLRANDLFGIGLGVQAGRFPWKTGRGRVFGHNDWMFGGPNVYDGLLLSWPCVLMPETGRWSLLAAQVNDFPEGHLLRRPQWITIPDPYLLLRTYFHDELNHTLFVLAGQFLDGAVQPFVSADFNVRELGITFWDADNLWHAGVYVGDTWNEVEFNVDAVYQFGMSRMETVRTDQTGREIERFKPSLNTWLLAADVGYGFDAPLDPKVTLGFDWSHGSYEYTDGMVGGLGSNHPRLRLPFSSHGAFRGATNIDWSYVPRFTDLFGEVEIAPLPKSTVTVAYHRFLGTQERRDQPDERWDLGQELDVIVDAEPLSWLALQAGYAAHWTRESPWSHAPRSPVISPWDNQFIGEPADVLDLFWLQASVRW